MDIGDYIYGSIDLACTQITGLILSSSFLLFLCQLISIFSPLCRRKIFFQRAFHFPPPCDFTQHATTTCETRRPSASPLYPFPNPFPEENIFPIPIPSKSFPIPSSQTRIKALLFIATERGSTALYLTYLLGYIDPSTHPG